MSGGCPVARVAREAPDSLALVFGDERWSYARLETRVRQAVDGLRARGIGPGDRLAVVASNHPDAVALLHATLRLGACLAPINTRLAAPERAELVTRLRPVLVLATADLADGVPVPGVEPLAAAFRGDGREPSWEGRRGSVLLFTSGTSGVPKGAVLTAANLDAAARASAEHLGSAPGDRWLCTLPLFHVGGWMMAYRAAMGGAALVLEPRFDPESVWRKLELEGITHASFVPTTLARVLEVRGQRPAPGALRVVLVGGAPVPQSLWRQARAAGLPVLKTYGLTEACSQVCTEHPDEADGATAGLPLPGVEVRVVREDGSAAEGEVGEIEVRGPTVMQGYFEDPEGTAAVLRDGWLRTGDLGVLDARGRLRIEARRTDLILSGGENVYPAEVEAVLETHPAIAEAAVVGAAHPEWGQVPVAFVVLRRRELAELDPWCRQRLGGFKVPRRFIPVTALPRSAMGKVDRSALQARVAQEQGEERT